MSKKTVQTIIDTRNDYLIQVKGNQQNLFRAVSEVAQHQTSMSAVSGEERARGRREGRTVTLFAAPPLLCEEWAGLQRIIHVRRWGSRDGKDVDAHSYYISSVTSDDAQVFANGIRGHWSIENRLHWVKDVIQYEDTSGIRKGNGVETLSILKNVAINICRELGFDSIKTAGIHFAGNVKELCTYFRT